MHAMIVGNSDGIGRALTERLLSAGCSVTGLSRSPAPFEGHRVVDVTSRSFPSVVSSVDDVDLFVHAAGVGDLLRGDGLEAQTRALEVVVPRMLAAGRAT